MLTHLLHIPFTGLGLYNGFRGNRWLRNRIQIFKQFVVPSLEAQTSQNFIVWVAWRPQEKDNKQVKALKEHLIGIFGEDRVVFTYAGICFWDDKYSEEEAHSRLLHSVHNTMATLTNHIHTKHVLMTIQPSDDCYINTMVEHMQRLFKKKKVQAVGYTEGYMMNYQTKELKEYNPKTNPPFYTIKFTKEVFTDPFKHAEYTSIKEDCGQYKVGTPIPSHEYVGKALSLKHIHERGFLVGCHGENISTHFNHPYGTGEPDSAELEKFGILNVPPLQIKYSLRKVLMRKLPHGWQRKLRYIVGEKIYTRIYNFLRN